MLFAPSLDTRWWLVQVSLDVVAVLVAPALLLFPGCAPLLTPADVAPPATAVLVAASLLACVIIPQLLF